VLLDAAHNPAGARALASHLQDIGWTCVTLIFGAMRDKDVNAMLRVLAPACGRIICTTAPTPRAMPAADLADAARNFVSTVEVVPDFTEALARSITYRNPVVAAGSIFLIGPVRDILR
jgi:dihydrofolate synthase/folylpolyglutamate synthase